MIYFKYLSMNLKSVLEYRLSSWFLAIGQAFTTIFSFLGMALLFMRFESLAGWSFTEAALCFGITGAAFSLSECFARGFDAFSQIVIQGEFDRVLLRPRNTIIQVLGSRTDIMRIGRFLVNLSVLLIIIPMTDISWDISRIFTLIMMLICGSVIFSGVFILSASVCFYTLEGLEIANIFTDGGRELASYPLPVYGRWVRNFFTFIIPYGTMNYLPLLYLTGRADAYPVLYMLMPIIGCLFIFPCLAIWRIGVRHYSSSGS